MLRNNQSIFGNFPMPIVAPQASAPKDIPVINVPGLGDLGDTIFNLTGSGGYSKLPREIRRDPAFRARFNLTENAPFQLGASQSTDLLQQMLAHPQEIIIHGPEAPPVPDFIQTPEGTYRFTDGGIAFEEDADKARLRRQREALISEFLTQLDEGVSPERLAQINEKADTFGRRTYKQAEKLLRQSELGRGRAGSAFDDATINLANEVAERAGLFAEDLFERDRQATERALGLVESGASGAAARALQAQGIGATDQFARQQLASTVGLENARMGTNANLGLLNLLNSRDLNLQGMAYQRQQDVLTRRAAEKQQRRESLIGAMNLAGTLAGTLASFAIPSSPLRGILVGNRVGG